MALTVKQSASSRQNGLQPSNICNLTLCLCYHQAVSHFFHAAKDDGLHYPPDMSRCEAGGEKPGNQEGELVAPRDLIDFYRRWPDFRLTATHLVDRPELSAQERQTVHWLILLVDRISEHDLQPLKPS